MWRLVILMLVLVACSSGGSSTVAVTGTVSVPAARAQLGDEPGCPMSAGYNDISSGTQVAVSDEKGTLVATGTLSGPQRDADRCRFSFTVTLPAGKGFYQFEVSHRGKVSFTPDQLKAQQDKVELTVG